MMTKEERQEFLELKKQVNDMEKKLNTILSIVKGIAIGLVIGGVLFGFLTFKDLITLVK